MRSTNFSQNITKLNTKVREGPSASDQMAPDQDACAVAFLTLNLMLQCHPHTLYALHVRSNTFLVKNVLESQTSMDFDL